MPAFGYTAIDAKGLIIRGKTYAFSPGDLEKRLAARSQQLISIRPMLFSQSALMSRQARRRVLIDFFFYLEQLLKAGVPLIEALSEAGENGGHESLRQTSACLVDDILAGQSFSEALTAYPHLFNSICVGLIKAGETSGRLPDVLHDFVEMLKDQEELASRTGRLLLYPTFALILVLAVLVFLMTHVVPQLALFIQSMNENLPLSTRVLLAVSEALSSYGLYLLPLPFLLFAALAYCARRYVSMRRGMDAWMLRLWLLGPLLNKIDMARLAKCFALMYGAGITVLDCLRLSESVVSNTAIAAALRFTRQTIEDGQSVALSFERAEIFPSFVIRMLKVGETTGNLDHALQNVAQVYMRDAREGVGRLQSLIEPCLTLALGALVGWIMLAVLGPVYDIIAKVKL